MDSLILGTGFDIAMVQNGLAPPEEPHLEDPPAELAGQAEFVPFHEPAPADFALIGDPAVNGDPGIDHAWLLLAMYGQ